MPITRTRSASRPAAQPKLQFPVVQPGSSIAVSNSGLRVPGSSRKVGPATRESSRSSKILTAMNTPTEASGSRLTRSTSKNSRGAASRNRNQEDGEATEVEDAVLFLTDTDEASTVSKKVKRDPSGKRPLNGKGKGAASSIVICPTEVLEISSDEETIHPPLTGKGVSNELGRLRKEVESLQAESKALRRENVELKLKQKNPGDRLAKELEEDVICEVCSSPMWEPCLLTRCGHSFCVSCVDDWFKRTLDLHVAAHPGYALRAQQRQATPIALGGQGLDYIPQLGYGDYYYQAVMRGQGGGQMHHLPPEMDQNYPKPDYTCPSCRTVVKTRPAEDFTLKKVVRVVVAAASGETSPKSKSKKRAARGAAVWDRYFTKEV